jgi:hypothetical protein
MYQAALAVVPAYRHCAGTPKVVMLEPYVEGIFPYGIEYTHETGCPRHEDSRPTVLAE